MANMVEPPRSVEPFETDGRAENKSLAEQRSGKDGERLEQLLLNEEYTIDTPENVTFGYEVAGIGSRFIGALIDTLIVFILWVLLSIAAFLALAITEGPSAALNFGGSETSWVGGIVVAGYILLNFILFWAYYIVFEYIWNGQTPGKRVAKIRVLRLDGNPIGLIQNLVRNLVRIADFFPFAYAVGLVAMFCNRHARRLGDFAAGTIVIRDQGTVTLSDLHGSLHGDSHSRMAANDGVRTNSAKSETGASEALSPTLTAPTRANDPLLQQFTQIHLLSTADYELIADALARQQQGKLSRSQLNRLSMIIATKIAAEPPTPASAVSFLQNVVEAYRRSGR